MIVRSAVMSVMLLVAMPVSAAPARIVSADGSLTEIVYALGHEARLAGVDTTSRYPSATAELPQIGYKRNLSAEGVLSLAPDTVIGTAESGPPQVLKQIEGVGVRVATFTSAPTLHGVRAKIEGVARLLEADAAGAALWRQVSAEIEQARQRVARIANPVRVLFVFSAVDRSPIVGGRSSGADTMITLAGGVNVATGVEGYKPMTPEAIIAARPELILMIASGGNHAVDPQHIFDKPGLAHTPAARDKRLVAMDGMYLLGFGPRIGQAIDDLARAFYPKRMDGDQ